MVFWSLGLYARNWVSVSPFLHRFRGYYVPTLRDGHQSNFHWDLFAYCILYSCLGMAVFGLQLYGMDDHTTYEPTQLDHGRAMALLPGVPCAGQIPHLTLGTRENVPARHANDVLEEILSQGRTEGITRIKLPKAKEMGRMGDGDGRMHV